MDFQKEWEKNLKNCNMLVGCPLIYWTWVINNDNGDIIEGLDWEGMSSKEQKIEHTIHLVFLAFHLSRAMTLAVKVTSDDEPKVREFIKKHQEPCIQ